MAESIGGVIWEPRGQDEDGRPLFRAGFYVWATNSSGVRKRVRIYSYPDELGGRIVFGTGPACGRHCGEDCELYCVRQRARRHLSKVQDAIVNGATVEAAIAHYLIDRQGSTVEALWPRFVDSHERASLERPNGITPKRLVELRANLTRGYLDYFRGIPVHELTSPMLVAWLDTFLRVQWPARPADMPRSAKPTDEQRAAGIRGFHSGKTRHHVMNDFLQFDAWLVEQGHVHPREHVLKKPASMPPISKGCQDVPDADSLRRYLDAIPEELRGVFLSRSIDGLRPSEARRMTVRNYDWSTGVLTILRRNTKTAKGERHFTVDWELRDWLERWVPLADRMNRDRPLFLNPRCWLPCAVARERARASKRGLPEPVITGHWTATAEKGVHDAACRELGAYFEPNVAGRHAAGTHMLVRSQAQTGAADAKAVQEKLGHESLATTERYLQRRLLTTASIDRIRPTRPTRAAESE